MGEFFKLILPILLQILPQLFNKPKAKLAEWWADGAQAAKAEKKPFTAFLFGSMECAVTGMDDGQYADVQLAIGNAAYAARESSKATAARQAQLATKGGAA